MSVMELAMNPDMSIPSVKIFLTVDLYMEIKSLPKNVEVSLF